MVDSLTPNRTARCLSIVMSTSPERELEGLLGDEDLVRRIARGLLFDEHAVDDVVQQTWMAAMRRPPAGVVGRRAWLATVARNVARNYGRGESRRRAREEGSAEAPPPELPAADAIFAREETRRRIVEAVRTLEEPYRTTILLRYFEGLPPRKIARRLGIKRDTVATRLKRGLHRLRQRLDGDYGARRAWALALVPLAAPTTTAAVLTTKAAAITGALITMKNVIAGACVVLLIALGIALASNPDPDPVDRDPSSPTVTGGGVTDDPDADATDVQGPISSAPYSEPSATTRHANDADSPSVMAALGGFRGRLIDPAGVPAAGQIVRLMSIDLMASFGSTSDPLGSHGAAGVASAETRTADDGTFTITRVAPGSMHALHAGIDGPHPTFKLLGRSVGPGEVVDLGDVELAALSSIEGIVVDENGEPVAGARVWAADLPPLAMQAAPFDRLVADGALLLALPAIDPKAVPNDATWHGHMRKHLAKTAITADRGAPFVVLDFPKWARDLIEHLPRATGTSDEHGRFRLDGVPLGRVSVVARVPGKTSGKRSVKTTKGAVVSAGALAVKSGRTLEARVVDAEGNGVPGAEVRVAIRPLFGLTGLLFAGPVSTSDANGKITQTGLPAGRVQIAYRAPNAPTWTVTGPLSTRKPIDLPLPAGTSASFVVRSETGESLEGLRIRLQQGPPLAEFAQAGLAKRHDLALGDLEQETTEDGGLRLTIPGLVAGVHTLVIHADGHAVTSGTVLSTAAGDEAVAERTFVLRRAATLSIRVQDEAGRPVHGAHVFAQEPGNPAWARSLLWSYAGLRGWDSLGRDIGRTDVNGRVRPRGLPAGERLHLTVRHPAFGADTIVADPDQEEVVFTFAAPGSIVGTIWDHGVRASPDKWRIVAEREDAPPGSAAPALLHQAVLDAEGRFRLDGLAPGVWSVEVVEAFGGNETLGGISREVVGGISFSFDDRSQEVVVLSGEETELAFELDRSKLPPGSKGCRLSGRILVDGKPEPTIVTVEGARWVRTNADGEFDVTGFASGRLSVTVRTPDMSIIWWNGFLMFGPEQHRTLDLEAQSAHLEVEILDATGAPADGHSFGFNGNVPGGGVFEIRSVRISGRAKIRVPAHPGIASSEGPKGRGSARIAPLPGSVEPVRIDLDSRGVLSGTVDTKGERTAFLFARAIIEGREHATGIVVRNGEFYFTGLRPATYQLTIEVDDVHYATAPPTIELGEEGQVGVELELGPRTDR